MASGRQRPPVNQPAKNLRSKRPHKYSNPTCSRKAFHFQSPPHERILYRIRRNRRGLRIWASRSMERLRPRHSSADCLAWTELIRRTLDMRSRKPVIDALNSKFGSSIASVNVGTVAASDPYFGSNIKQMFRVIPGPAAQGADEMIRGWKQ